MRGRATPALALLAERNMPDWLLERIDAVRRLGNLPENWDSYGGRPVRPEAQRVAYEVIRELAKLVGVDKPLVGATSEGNVSLEWQWNDGTRTLDLEVRPDGNLHYAYMDSESGEEREQLTTTLEPIAIWLTRI